MQNQVEAAYARSDLFDRRRTLMNDWEAYLADTHPHRPTVEAADTNSPEPQRPDPAEPDPDPAETLPPTKSAAVEIAAGHQCSTDRGSTSSIGERENIPGERRRRSGRRERAGARRPEEPNRLAHHNRW